MCAPPSDKPIFLSNPSSCEIYRFWQANESTSMHSSWPPNFRKERFTLPDFSFGHCIGILFWDPLSQSLVEQPCYKPLTRLNIAMNLGMKVKGICTDCFVRGTRIFHNVHLLNNFNCGMAPAFSTCKNCSTMKLVSNCSVNLSHNRVSYNSRCFTCNAMNQAGNKRSNPFAFVRSRANHVSKRAKVTRNQHPVEHVVPAAVVEQIHKVIIWWEGASKRVVVAIVSTVDEAPFSNPRVLVLQVGNLCRTFLPNRNNIRGA